MSRIFDPPWPAIGLHAAGFAMLGSAWAEGTLLVSLVRADGGADPGVIEFLLAALMLGSASVGTMLTIWGPGLWAPVTISDRWSDRASGPKR